MTGEQHESTRMEEGAYDDTIDLAKYVLMLWRHRLPIVVGALLCGLAAFVVNELTPPTYEATAKLIVTPPKTGAVNDSTPTLSVATFRALVENQSLGAAIVDEFGLNKEPHRVTPDAFVARCVRVEAIRDTNVIVVKVRLWDRDLAARVANRLARAAVQLAQQLNQDETVSARDILEAQLGQSKKRLDQAEQRLEEFRRKAQIELLRKDVDALLGQRGALLALLVEIQAEQARLSQAEAQLANRGRIDTLKRSIDTDPAAMEAARRGSNDAGTVLPLQLRNEFINPVYESLDQVIAASRTRLAGLQKQKSELIDVRKLDRDQQAKLSLLYQQEMELSRLQTEYDLSRAVYVDVATRNEQIRLQVAGRSAQLQVMDAALPPGRPVSPRVLRNTAAALVLGFMLMVIGVLFFSAVNAAVARETAR
jgi:succinoglycan biosynthesis transport protein ExoP